MQKNVIITRSYDENLILAQKVKELGLKPILSPMLSHEATLCDFTQFQNYTDIIITSKFASHIICKHYPYNVDAWVIGEESAELLSHNNKINVRANYDSVIELIEALKDTNHRVSPYKRNSSWFCGAHLVSLGLRPLRHSNFIRSIIPGEWHDTQKKFLYLSGDNISQEILFADRQVIYQTEYAQILSDEVLEIIQKNGAHFIMFYSKNSAVNFIDLVKRYKSLQNLKNSVVIAISNEVGSVSKAYVKDVFYSAKPTANKMLELLCAQKL